VVAPAQVLDLVERFGRNQDAYRSGSYNETQARREFIDPFFKALGWDIDNEAGYAPAYKDVVHEDAIKVGGLTKAPDYCFRIGGTRKFFVEAKRPAVNLKTDVSPAFQLRRYSWSAKLPLSILTDFQELAIYDCRIQPFKTDSPAIARTLYFQYTDYAERWSEIASVFGKEAVLQGSFDRYAESTKGKRGTAEVDAAFLKEIEEWRSVLAHTIALRNPGLSQRELNYAVQVTIDRIIFLRICEDRGIEDYGELQSLGKGAGTYARLLDLFRKADQRYNSGLFHFERERDRGEEPDTLTASLTIDDKTLKDILKRLYYPDSPYEFSVLPADILGQVYEQFLGKVIRLTTGHRAVVEDKPEVKKAGGVYYTPTHIVDYIVKHTIGTLLEGLTPKKASSVRILDPACGSGSFLIGAFQCLMDWHRDWYIQDGHAKHTKELFVGAGGEWRLTTAEKRRILLNNIYGVDLDTQAVETTKLSLLLKVLEGETQETINAQLSFLRERALPDLANNIKCGNSLIGPEFYEKRPLGLFSDDERWRINLFDWKSSYPEVFGADDPGFDAIIGNPPYIRIQSLREWAPIEAEFYKNNYASARRGNYDIYVVFVERGLDLLNGKGRLGFILPSKFLSTDYGAALRRRIAESRVLDQVVDFGHEQVFSQATTYTCLLFLKHGEHESARYLRAAPKQLTSAMSQPKPVHLDRLSESPWILAGGLAEILRQKLVAHGQSLLDLPVAMSRGTSTGNDDVFCLRAVGGEYCTRHGIPVQVESSILRKPVWASDFTRYWFRTTNEEMLIFPYEISDGGYRLLTEGEVREHYPQAYRYLSDNRPLLEKRKQFQSWFGFSAPRNLATHEKADFLVPLLADRGLCAPLPGTAEGLCLMASGGFSVGVSKDAPVHPNYVLGLVNSRLLFWYLRQISNKFRGGWITCTKQYFGTLPIACVDRRSSESGEAHDRVVSLVEQATNLNERAGCSRAAHERDLYLAELQTVERLLDQIVYGLYGLSDEEIAIVEEDQVC